MREIERDEERPIVSHCSADEPVWPFSSLNNLSSLSLYVSLSLCLSSSPPHISLYMPVTDLDTNNFSPFISVPCFSSCYILLSSNKILKRHTRSIHSANNRPSQSDLLRSIFFHECRQPPPAAATHKLNLRWQRSQLQSKQKMKLNTFTNKASLTEAGGGQCCSCVGFCHQSCSSENTEQV